ncbi:carbonic anhydrase-like [Procambarus clarkii]|uniref:carbonic anhydrase-like n=1 Tax=Procambarus clarkii TaxID=6728 RepID=UPI0037438846
MSPGPSFWANTFPTCGGANQSPIDIVTSQVKGSYPWLDFGFKNYDVTPNDATITNNGHSAQVTIGQNPAPTVQGGDLLAKYTFLQLHFHWGSKQTMGSEHTVDGKRYAAELHMVHYKTEYGSSATAVSHTDGLAVLAIFLEVGPVDNPNLKSIVQGLSSIHQYNSQQQIAPFPLRNLLPTNVAEFYSYQGSLTTPPCSEIVTWTVFKNPITISLAQLEKFWELIGEDGDLILDNFRPTLPVGSRTSVASPLTGPQSWPTNYPTCGASAQSPIDIVIVNTVLTLLPAFAFTGYDALPAKTTPAKQRTYW